MKHFNKLALGLLLIMFGSLFAQDALAYTNEVRQSGSSYIWRVNNVDQGSTSDLATAINNAIGTGNREVHILTGGTLSSTINLQAGLVLRFHNNTLNKNHSGYGFLRDGSGPIEFYDLTLNNNANMGIRISRASDLVFSNVKIYGGSIGIRVDSHPSRPYEEGRWVYNVSVQNCRFENNGSHGLETYGVDGFTANTIVARNCGECGVLLNKTINGTIGTVDAYRCSYGGGYAGLRFANDCSNVTTNMLYADECGRGYFVLTGSNNIHLNNCRITDCTNIGIWLENVVNCTVKAGCSNCGVAVSGSGSYANVSNSCSSSGGGTAYQIKNRATGLFLDGMGSTSNGSPVCQWGNTTHPNSKWEMIAVGNYYQFKNVATGMFIDGYGYTTNGADVNQYSNTTHVNSQWSIVNVDGTYVRIQNRGTGLFLDGMGRTTNGAAAGQWSNTSHVNAQWQLISVLKSAVLDTEELETSNNKNLQINPNPALSDIMIQLPNDIKQANILVYDLSGKEVMKAQIQEGSHTLNIALLAPGIYILKAETENWSAQQKLVKQ